MSENVDKITIEYKPDELNFVWYALQYYEHYINSRLLDNTLEPEDYNVMKQTAIQLFEKLRLQMPEFYIVDSVEYQSNQYALNEQYKFPTAEDAVDYVKQRFDEWDHKPFRVIDKAGTVYYSYDGMWNLIVKHPTKKLE